MKNLLKITLVYRPLSCVKKSIFASRGVISARKVNSTWFAGLFALAKQLKLSKLLLLVGTSTFPMGIYGGGRMYTWQKLIPVTCPLVMSPTPMYLASLASFSCAVRVSKLQGECRHCTAWVVDQIHHRTMCQLTGYSPEISVISIFSSFY